MNVSVVILGCRGSIPVCGKEFSKYGGATCSILVKTEREAILLDAGTGMLNLTPHIEGKNSASVLLTHTHVDHLLGITMNAEAANSDFVLDIYAATRNGLDARTQVETLLAPPLWPINTEQLPAKIYYHELLPHFEINGISVDAMEGCHPGGVSVIRITAETTRIALVTDCTINADNHEQLLDFCRGCDLLLCDGQYSDEEWNCCSDYGHNTWKHAAQFALECGAKKARLIHHAPTHTDTILDEARKQAKDICAVCDIAFDGEELVL